MSGEWRFIDVIEPAMVLLPEVKQSPKEVHTVQSIHSVCRW